MVVNVLTSSQKYLFFVETNTAGYCHFRTSPAVFVKTKKQIFLTKTRDIYSHFWGGIYQILPAGYCPEVSSNMFLVAANTAGDVLTSQKVTAGSCQEVSSKTSSFVVTSTTS